MTFLSRSADDRPRLRPSTRRSRWLQDFFLVATFLVCVAFSAAFVFGIIGH